MTGPIADVAASYGDDNLSPKQTHTKRTMLRKNAGGQFSHNSVMRTDSDISERMVHNIPPYLANQEWVSHIPFTLLMSNQPGGP